MKLAPAETAINAGWMALTISDPVAAERYLRAGYETFQAMGERAYLAIITVSLAEALYHQGRFDEAAHMIGEPLDAASPSYAARAAFLQPGDLHIPRIHRRTPPRPRRTRQHAGVPGPPPLDHVAGIQALAAQHRALLTSWRRVIISHHVQLVLRGETPPAGPLGHLRIRALLRLAGHPSSIAGHQGTVEHGHGHLRDYSIPALEESQ